MSSDLLMVEEIYTQCLPELQKELLEQQISSQSSEAQQEKHSFFLLLLWGKSQQTILYFTID